MAKKKTAKKSPDPMQEMTERLPPEVAEKLKATKAKLEKFKKAALEKFDKYITGIALLPPPKDPKPEEKDLYDVLILVDDSEPTKMSKAELRDKLATIMEATAKDIDKNIRTQTLLLSEVWQNCYDAKYDLLSLIQFSAPIHDTGMLGAIKIAEVHKQMVLKKFEKYIVTYVLAGSLVQGRATAESDIDVWIVIDDTDVKKMSRAELKDKLRAIILGMGYDAGNITGIKNKINIQTYILTDFWDSVKEANPVIFTLLRDGVPFYDRGIFMPWKQLLKMGKIKPSTEAIDIFMRSGEQTLERSKFKLRDMGSEDFFWALSTPAQAALMLYGIPPPAPKELGEVMRDIFVKKEKLLEEEYVKIWENVLKVRKDIEHGVKKEVSGKEIDKLLADSQKFIKRLHKLFTQMEKIKQEEAVVHLYDTVQTVVRDVLKLEGVEKVNEKDLVSTFEDKLVSTAVIPAKYVRSLKNLIKAKKDYDAGKLTKTEVEQTRKDASDLIKVLVEHMQRKRGRALEQTKIKVKYGEKYGEVTLLGNTAFIIKDMDAPEKQLTAAPIRNDGSIDLGQEKKSSWDEFEKALARIEIPKQVFVKEPVFESLKNIFGKDVEILVYA